MVAGQRIMKDGKLRVLKRIKCTDLPPGQMLVLAVLYLASNNTGVAAYAFV
jgi:hypothetical protein